MDFSVGALLPVGPRRTYSAHHIAQDRQLLVIVTPSSFIVTTGCDLGLEGCPLFPRTKMEKEHAKRLGDKAKGADNDTAGKVSGDKGLEVQRARSIWRRVMFTTRPVMPRMP
jgi:hypothetical protein